MPDECTHQRNEPTWGFEGRLCLDCGEILIPLPAGTIKALGIDMRTASFPPWVKDSSDEGES